MAGQSVFIKGQNGVLASAGGLESQLSNTTAKAWFALDNLTSGTANYGSGTRTYALITGASPIIRLRVSALTGGAIAFTLLEGSTFDPSANGTILTELARNRNASGSSNLVIRSEATNLQQDGTELFNNVRSPAGSGHQLLDGAPALDANMVLAPSTIYKMRLDWNRVVGGKLAVIFDYHEEV